MRRFGGAVIHMQRSLDNDELTILESITFLVGKSSVINDMLHAPAMSPFDECVIDFLDLLSKKIMKSRESKLYSDVVTLGFWLRKSSILALKSEYNKKDRNIYLGKGIAFHIAPSNVAVNFAYSLVSGLLTGNANIVRIPTQEFPQIKIIVDAINEALSQYKQLVPYIILVRYGRDKAVNDLFSSISDTRIIWGGDATIRDIRKSPLSPRAGEITFADRYSIALIDTDYYMELDDKFRIAERFYNDTYLSDQNACTSPRLIVWMGNKKEKAKNIFWEELYRLVEGKYNYQAIQGINKLTSSYMVAVHLPGTKIKTCGDNLIVRIEIPQIIDDLMEMKENSGFFFEYDCNDIMELEKLCDDRRCQTVGYLGDRNVLLPLFLSGIHGIDRVVPIGKTMDFEMIWDGYNLFERLTRVIRMV